MQLASNYLMITIIIMLKISVSSGGTSCLHCKHHLYDAVSTPNFDASAERVNSNKFHQVIGGGRFIQMKQNQQCQKNFIGLKRHPIDTKLYYICRQNSIILAKCDESQFSENDKLCVTTKNQTKTSTDTTACFMSGIYPDPRDTRYYYTCIFYKQHFIKRNYKCPDRNLFNATEKKCVEINKPSSCSTPENCGRKGECMSNRNFDIKPPQEIFQIIKKKKKELVRFPYNYKPTELIEISSAEDSRYNDDFIYLHWFNSKNKVGTKRSRLFNCPNCRSTKTRPNEYNIAGSHTDDVENVKGTENQNGINNEGINDEGGQETYASGTGHDENFDIYKDSQNEHTICNDSEITKNDETSNDGNKDIDEGDLKTEYIGTKEDNKCEKGTEKNDQTDENGEPESLSAYIDNNMKDRSNDNDKFSNGSSYGEQNKGNKIGDKIDADGNLDSQNQKSDQNVQNTKSNDGTTENGNGGGRANSSGNVWRMNNGNEPDDTRTHNFVKVSCNDEITQSDNQRGKNNKNCETGLDTTKSNEQTDSEDTTINIEKPFGTDALNDIIIVKEVNGSIPNNEDDNANDHGTEPTESTREFENMNATTPNHNTTKMREHDNENTHDTINGSDTEIQIIKQSEPNEPKPISNTTKETVQTNPTDEIRTGAEGKGNDNGGDIDTDSEIKNENKNDLDKSKETNPKENQTFVVKSDDNDPINDRNTTAKGRNKNSNDGHIGASSGNGVILLNKEADDSNNLEVSDNKINGTGTQNTETIFNEDQNADTNDDPSNKPLGNNDQTDQNSRPKEVDVVAQKINETENGANNSQNNLDTLTEIEICTDPNTWSLLENVVGTPNNNNPDVGEINGTTSDQMTDTKTVNGSSTNRFIVADTVESQNKEPDNNREMDNEPETVNRTETGASTTEADECLEDNKTVINIVNNTVLENNNASNVDNESDGIRGNEDNNGLKEDKKADRENETVARTNEEFATTVKVDEFEGQPDIGTGTIGTNDDTIQPILNNEATTDSKIYNATNIDSEPHGIRGNEDNKGFGEDIQPDINDGNTDAINPTYTTIQPVPNNENNIASKTNNASNVENKSEGVLGNKDAKSFAQDTEVDTTGMDKITTVVYTNKEETSTTPVLNNENNLSDTNDATIDNKPNGARGNEGNKSFEEVKEIGTAAEGRDGINEDFPMTDIASEFEDLPDIGTDTKGTDGHTKGINANREKTYTTIQPISNIENNTVSETSDASNVDNESYGIRETDNKPGIETQTDIGHSTAGMEDNMYTTQIIPNIESKAVLETNDASNVGNEFDGVRGNQDNKGFEEDKEVDRNSEDTDTAMDSDTEGINDNRANNTVFDTDGAPNLVSESNKNKKKLDDNGIEMNKETESNSKIGLVDESGKQLPQRNGLVQVTAVLPKIGLIDASGKQSPQKNGLVQVTAVLPKTGLINASGKQSPQRNGLVQVTAVVPKTVVSKKRVLNRRVL